MRPRKKIWSASGNDDFQPELLNIIYLIRRIHMPSQTGTQQPSAKKLALLTVVARRVRWMQSEYVAYFHRRAFEFRKSWD